MAASYAAARRHSDKKFLIMPADETSTVGLGLGGHSDIMYSHPVYWLEQRAPGEPLVEDHPVYGKLYRIGGAADMMEMTTAREHPRLHAASENQGLAGLSRCHPGHRALPP